MNSIVSFSSIFWVCLIQPHQALPIGPILYLGGLVQDCGHSIVNALELPQSCTKPNI